MRFNPVAVAKLVASGIVGIGTTKIVSQVIKNNITPNNLFDKVATASAGWVIGAMVADQTKAYTDKAIDDAVETGTKIVNRVKISFKLARVNRGESTLEEEGVDIASVRKNEEGKWEWVDSAEEATPTVETPATV